MSEKAITYRADIDGLRAVAIIPVVLFHAGFSQLSGGFVGVDVFFVISGYLITSIIANEIDDGTFTFLRFYERRVRRLMPTLFTVLAVSLVAGLLLLSPFDFRKLAGSALYTLIFASNFHFANAGGYFDQPLGLAPLLHTWSLAVEEQFYIVWPPLLLLCCSRARRAVVWIVPGLLVVSFAIAVRFAGDSSATFYWPHARAWELLIGCVLALGLLPPPPRRSIADVASMFGLALIAFAILTFDETTPFPGTPALAPTVGAGLVIWSGANGASLGGRLLSLRPFVLIGLVSYAWYLWHWPMFAFFRIVEGREPDVLEAWILIAVSLALAFASWQYLEKPVRRRGPLSSRALATVAVSGTLLLAAASATIVLTRGLLHRFPEQIARLDRGKIRAHKSVRCAPLVADGERLQHFCKLVDGKPGGRSVVVWGDSHAGAYAPGLVVAGLENSATVYQATRVKCPPLLDVFAGQGTAALECRDHNARVAELIGKLAISDVIIAMRWPVYVSDSKYTRLPAAAREHQLRDSQSKAGIPATQNDENREVVRRGLVRTVGSLKATGVRVWLTEPIPEPGFDVPGEMARMMMRGADIRSLPPLPRARHRADSSYISSVIAELNVDGLAHVLDPATQLCGLETCRFHDELRPLYSDDNHLSTDGSRFVAKMFAPVFAAAGVMRARASTIHPETSR